ncbi:hypothetical protein [Hymenobacter yonginensis]|uniref:Uncharacterized protein n=1 Tax=Hymenobacter yonginensis TaxID=748197 RepID=A0ABY7PUF3_9BACT|nr:hypothetical protein [Hymenobacter yonginensis]WBO86548.1 hypothetical protein O9Z63_09855 [Hymenobacter yonginensis]
MANTIPEEDFTPDEAHNTGADQWQQKRTRRAEIEAEAPSQRTLETPKLFEAKPDDGAVVRFFKRLGRMGQVVFGVLLAVFIAIVAFAAG